MILDNRYYVTCEAAEGKLLLDIYAINKYRPLTTAIAGVYAREGGRRGRRIAELAVNSAGQTAEIYLSCPSLMYSQGPSGVKPYSEYDVEVTADGFVPAIVRGVQIFAGQTSLLEVVLRAEGEHTGKCDEIIVKDNTLSRSLSPPMSEDMIKPEPPLTGFFALDEPTAPEYIVVHDGSPNDTSAPNYFVKYKDYIKNVAAGAIYPTWSEAAISASILAIISFTLNRVFTGWYRSMGKNYSVTSSPVYDNAFCYGRNTYAVTSDIVDELFVNYISAKGIRQPLLTRCINENKWTAKRLGDSGSTGLEIIKELFGQEVYLNTVARVMGAPFSYPGYRLEKGVTGEEVRSVQRQLNVISKNYPMIPKTPEDGVYSKNTERAIYAFQHIFKCNTSGVVDFPVWYRISEVYVSVKRMSDML